MLVLQLAYVHNFIGLNDVLRDSKMDSHREILEFSQQIKKFSSTQGCIKHIVSYLALP